MKNNVSVSSSAGPTYESGNFPGNIVQAQCQSAFISTPLLFDLRFQCFRSHGIRLDFHPRARSSSLSLKAAVRPCLPPKVHFYDFDKFQQDFRLNDASTGNNQQPVTVTGCFFHTVRN